MALIGYSSHRQYRAGGALIRLAGGVVMTLAVIFVPTMAATPPATQPSTDAAPAKIKRGRAGFDTCRGCHAIAGYRNAYPNYAVPRLAGQSADYIEAALADYRSGARRNRVMQAQARSLSESQIHDIAVYLSQTGGQPAKAQR